MLNIEITESTPANMLRAIRAACNELLGETNADLTTQAAQHNSRAVELHAAAEVETDKAAACLTAHTAERQTAASPALAAPYGKGGSVDASQFYRVGEQHSEQIVWAQGLNEPPMGRPLTDAPGNAPTAIQIIEPIEDNRLDRVHVPSDVDSSGTEWNPDLHASTKAKNQDGTWKKRRGAGKETDAPEPPAATPGLPPLPPTPPAPAAPLVTMNDIYALITNGKAVLNDVIAGARAMGFADVGAFSRDATPEQRAQLLAQLTKEVA